MKSRLNPRNRKKFEFPRLTMICAIYTEEEYKRMKEKKERYLSAQSDEDRDIINERARIIIKDYFDEFGNKGTETKQL